MYRIFSVCLLLLCAATGIYAQPGPEPYGYDLNYFLPKGNYTYNPAVPTPQQVLGFQIGQQHAECDGEQQQRLEFVTNSQIKQEERHANHDDALPSHGPEESDDTRGFDEFLDALSNEIGGCG